VIRIDRDDSGPGSFVDRPGPDNSEFEIVSGILVARQGQSPAAVAPGLTPDRRTAERQQLCV